MSLNSEKVLLSILILKVLAREIAESRSLDVIEIDGASNRGIEEIRNLGTDKVCANGVEVQIIIIDEVHMLTNQAFNALLRTLRNHQIMESLFLQLPMYIKFLLQ